MKPAGLVLIVLGLLALAYEGITYTTREKVLDLGPLGASTERRETIPLPPVLSGAAVVAGVALLVMSTRQRS